MIQKIILKIRSIYFFLKQEREIRKSNDIDISDIKTICLVFGPYRNLTSLSATMAVLHPNCQVLNHAQRRILPHKKVNFFMNYSETRFNRFIKYAIQISLSGKRGIVGGSILHSHAFDKLDVKEKYKNRFGDKLLKEKINCLFWKEGLHLQNHFLENNINTIDLINKNKKIVFILPIRNPLDCAMSNQNTGMSNIFHQINPNSTYQEILKSILDNFLLFFNNQKQLSSNFFHYYQHSFNESTLKEFCNYLDLPFDERWKNDVLDIYNIKESYPHKKEDIDFYEEYVSTNFKDFPDEMEKLLQFIK
jgi:hypothetical protein